MISETTFARDFASFWRGVTPFMDGFVRRVNRGTYERDFEPLDSDIIPSRRAFVNEVAFSALCKVVESKTSGAAPSLATFILAAENEIYLAAAPELQETDYRPPLSPDERSDADSQVRRVLHTLGKKKCLCRPQFQGCGIVDRCEGDLLVEGELVELKAGDRRFRSIDFRQVLTYLALNHASREHAIDSVALMNPRVGISVRLPTSKFCYEISGRDASQLLDTIAYTMFSGDISR